MQPDARSAANRREQDYWRGYADGGLDALKVKSESAASPSPQDEWERAYSEAMRWRDWQTCEILIDEREQADWYAPAEDDGTEDEKEVAKHGGW